MSNNRVHSEAPKVHVRPNVGVRRVKGRALLGHTRQNTVGASRRQVVRPVVGIVGGDTWLAGPHRNDFFRLFPTRARRYFQEQELLINGPPVGGRDTRSDAKDLERASPIQG